MNEPVKATPAQSETSNVAWILLLIASLIGIMIAITSIIAVVIIAS